MNGFIFHIIQALSRIEYKLDILLKGIDLSKEDAAVKKATAQSQKSTGQIRAAINQIPPRLPPGSK